MVTGVNAGRHGIWDFSERDETGYQSGSSTAATAARPRSGTGSGAGRRVGILNVPFTWPAPEVNGFGSPGSTPPRARTG